MTKEDMSSFASYILDIKHKNNKALKLWNLWVIEDKKLFIGIKINLYGEKNGSNSNNPIYVEKTYNKLLEITINNYPEIIFEWRFKNEK